MFDVNPKIIGLKINDIEVMDSERLLHFLKANPIDIGILTTDKAAAQSVADKLVEGKDPVSVVHVLHSGNSINGC